MNNFYSVLMFIFLLLSVSCSADDEDQSQTLERHEYYATKEESQNRDDVGHYKILIIGNSLSRDAFSYVPSLVKDLCPNISLDIEIYYKGGVGLANHWNSIVYDLKDHNLDTFNETNNSWSSRGEAIGKNIIGSKQWDLVVLQEGNVTCKDYEQTSFYVNTFSDYIHSIQPFCKIAYIMVPSQPEGSPVLGDATSDEFCDIFANTARQLFENGEVDYIIPDGIAIQNARHTYLDAIGGKGHLTYDGVHLQEGLPCLIAAYTVSQSLFNILGINSSIQQSGFRMSLEWFFSQNIPGQHGKLIDGPEQDYELCKKCAIAAIDQPFSITIFE